MNTSLSTWLVIIAALFAANLPFFNQRLFAVFPLRAFSFKPFWMRLLELITAYFLIGALGFFLESSAGNRYEQNWEFYAITACLFVVLAFPGFVFRYLRK